MERIRRPLGFIVAGALALCPLCAGAQDASTARERATANPEAIRIQVNVNFFFPGPTGESEDAVKLRERARRTVYEMAASECTVVEQSLAKTCRLESINVNINRQQAVGQTEGYTAAVNFQMRVTPK